MEFSSIVFLLRFLPIFIICYFLAPGRTKNIVLLLGSLCFFAWGEPFYVVLMLISTISDYIHALMIEKYRGQKAAKLLLLNALFIDLSLLYFFAYSDITISAINAIAGTRWMKFGFALPVGITVYTLQTISYVTDVYFGRVKACRSLFHYAVYVSMFPQLLAGPIVRYRDIESALTDRKPDLAKISSGAKRICIGLGKKVLFADSAWELWQAVEKMDHTKLGFGTAWMGMLGFAFWMYFGYSGYADIAKGLGECMGFDFPDNYHHPYASHSVADFWRRWNVTLGAWMREYVLQPMQKSEHFTNTLMQILVIGSLTGLWYGADATFLLWGIWMALFLGIEKLFLEKILDAVPILIGWFYTMVVVAIGWVLFAMDSLSEALIYLQAMFGGNGNGFFDDHFWYLWQEYLVLIMVGSLISMPVSADIIARIKEKRSGFTIALYRLGEKIIPPMLLILSLIYIVGRVY